MKIVMGGHVARMGDSTGAYRVLVGKPEGKKQLENPDVEERLFKWNLKT